MSKRLTKRSIVPDIRWTRNELVGLLLEAVMRLQKSSRNPADVLFVQKTRRKLEHDEANTYIHDVATFIG